MLNEDSSRKLVKNTTMLYAMNFTKIVLPLVTLPYLTRVLSKDVYGTVAYVKAVMQYMQVIVDFGFLLSGTRDIVNSRTNKDTLNRVIGDTLLAKLILVGLAFVALISMMLFIPILRSNVIYTLLSFVVVAQTCFLMDFVFRGLEEMQVITIRYVLMRLIAAVLTFIVIKNDSNMLLIPILDIVGSFAAIVLVFYEMRKRDIKIVMSGVKGALEKLKDSAVFFLSNMATTAFSGLNTIVIGIMVDPVHVAEWSVCMQMVAAVQSFYTPVTDGIYPYMVKNKDFKLIKKTLYIFMPLITAGCIFTFFVAKYALLIIGGEKYISAVPLLRAFIPLLFISFPAILFGWPTLGAIGKTKETTLTTLITAGLQIAGIAVLILINRFNVILLAMLRGTTELCMFLMRYYYCKRFYKEFSC